MAFHITIDKVSGNTTAHVLDQRRNFIISTTELNMVPGAIELHGAIPVFVDAAEQAGKRYLGEERNERMFKAFQNVIARPLKGYLTGATSLQVGITAELAKYESVPVAANCDESLARIETRQILRNADPERVARILKDADWRTLAAIISAGPLESDLNPDLYNLAKERFKLQNLIKALGLYANHKNQPSLEKLITTGINEESAEQEARAVLANRAEKLAAVKLAESTIRRVIAFCGLLTGKSDADILAELV